MTNVLGVEPSSQLQQEPKKSTSTGQLVAGFVAGIGLLLVVLLVLDSFHIISLSQIVRNLQHPEPSSTQNTSVPNVSTNNDNQNVIAKVGAESIYQKDLDIEYSYYPLEKNSSNTKTILQKIAKDSIILQAAAKEGLLKLDNTIFNSPQKDYLQRVKKVKELTEEIDKRKLAIKGSIITIWFNNMGPGKIGYQKGKEIANAKITKIHEDVVNKKITMQQAGEQIKNDASLADVDAAYKSNAYLDFNNSIGEAITFSPEFDAIIKAANTNDVTAVYLAKDKDRQTKQIIDSAYMFAYIEAKELNGKTEDFDTWYAQKEKAYEVILY